MKQPLGERPANQFREDFAESAQQVAVGRHDGGSGLRAQPGMKSCEHFRVIRRFAQLAQPRMMQPGDLDAAPEQRRESALSDYRGQCSIDVAPDQQRNIGHLGGDGVVRLQARE
ncbi:MAG: hypothetical protein ABI794_14410 [Betaproteobacteria bacterium]